MTVAPDPNRRPRKDRLLPGISAQCQGCRCAIPAGGEVMMVPVEWVIPTAGQPTAFLVFCGRCAMPDGPAADRVKKP